MTAGTPILLLTELFPPAVGGSAVLFANVYSRIEGHPVTVLTQPHPQIAGVEASFPSLRIVREDIATRRWGVLNPRAFAHHWWVASLIRRHADARGVVHCGRSLPEGLAALLAGARGGPTYVCWTHGEDIATAQSSRELTFLTRLVYQRAAGAFANSNNTAQVLERLGVARDRVSVVYPGVDAERFSPDIDGSAIRAQFGGPDVFLVLSVGRLQRRKGHDLALAAVAALRDRLPALHYVIVGSGEEESRLKTLIADYRIADRVTMVGEISDSDLPAYYAACDVFLMPNRMEGTDFEGFGIVFLEAAASGKPVIGGRSGGVPEAVEDGVTGQLVGGLDPAELADRIQVFADKPDLRRRMGEAARERARNGFTWQRSASSVAELHNRIFDENTHG